MKRTKIKNFIAHFKSKKRSDGLEIGKMKT